MITDAGFTEIVQLLINSANDTERLKRMLESVDAEGDTVSACTIFGVECLVTESKPDITLENCRLIQ